jgi:hypothetical protein
MGNARDLAGRDGRARLSPRVAPPARVKALVGAAQLAIFQNDIPRAKALWEELLALGRDSGDEATEAWALGRLG